jgi:hypothetical protein
MYRRGTNFPNTKSVLPLLMCFDFPVFYFFPGFCCCSTSFTFIYFQVAMSIKVLHIYSISEFILCEIMALHEKSYQVGFLRSNGETKLSDHSFLLKIVYSTFNISKSVSSFFRKYGDLRVMCFDSDGYRTSEDYSMFDAFKEEYIPYRLLVLFVKHPNFYTFIKGHINKVSGNDDPFKYERFRFLLKFGIEMDKVDFLYKLDYDYGSKIVYSLCTLREVRLLVMAGVDVNITSPNYANSLFFTPTNDFGPAIAEFLIECGADPTFVTSCGTNALLHILESFWLHNDEIAKILILNGAEVNISTVGYLKLDEIYEEFNLTPLLLAVYKNMLDVAKMLLQRGADKEAMLSLDEDCPYPKIQHFIKSDEMRALWNSFPQTT